MDFLEKNDDDASQWTFEDFQYKIREYPFFNDDDEIFTKKKFKAIRSNISYKVIRCYKPYDGFPSVMVELMSDGGYISRYASHSFEKTPTQIRQDIIEDVLNYKKNTK